MSSELGSNALSSAAGSNACPAAQRIGALGISAVEVGCTRQTELRSVPPPSSRLGVEQVAEQRGVERALEVVGAERSEERAGGEGAGNSSPRPRKPSSGSEAARLLGLVRIPMSLLRACR